MTNEFTDNRTEEGAVTQKTDVLRLFPDELAEFLAGFGEPKYRAKQLFTWLHAKRAASFDEMTDLPARLRETLERNAVIVRLQEEMEKTSALDGSKKFLFRLPDGNIIESMLMPYRYGNSVCVSTQVGCRMGCAFCASTIGGLVRSLSASEILGEVYEIERITGENVNHVVLMGGGEPFDNYDETVRFMRLIAHPSGKDLSFRNITVSTSGIPERIVQFSRENIPVTLALSLHASDDETRKKIMPVARKYPLSEVIAAADTYFKESGRRVTYEYAVVSDVNDSEEDALKLSKLLAGKNAHVNLIPVNPVAEKAFRRPDRAKMSAFQNILEKNGIHATIRREIGLDIDGACGQLRYKAAKPCKEKENG